MDDGRHPQWEADSTQFPNKEKVPLIFSQYHLQMCIDLHDFWYAASQLNTNHAGQFTTLRITLTLCGRR